jgi:hypothetical protein
MWCVGTIWFGRHSWSLKHIRGQSLFWFPRMLSFTQMQGSGTEPSILQSRPEPGDNFLFGNLKKQLHGRRISKRSVQWKRKKETHLNTLENCRAVAQAVSRWLPTAAARVRVRAACGICGGQSGIEASFLRVLRFLLPIIPPISPSHNHPGLAQ